MAGKTSKGAKIGRNKKGTSNKSYQDRATRNKESKLAKHKAAVAAKRKHPANRGAARDALRAAVNWSSEASVAAYKESRAG